MDSEQLVGRILDDESLTDGLEDPEARVLIEWLVAKAERLAAESKSDNQAKAELEKLCKQARVVRRFVILWCQQGNPGAATQLAAVEKLPGALPTRPDADPCAVMQALLTGSAEESRLGSSKSADGLE
jgi:hypothetical protein